ncbi:MAG: glycosyltransferase family 4 protein [Leadbetterella sp.]|nr:glycosyltransferase family 4 protein [Leadbetterella sp.]
MNKIALIGNFPPRKCGIATFTKDLLEGIRSQGTTTAVIAMNDGLKKYNYPPDVEFEIDQNEIASYIHAANFLNTNNFDAVILQHEFGIFGGRDGRHIIQLLKRLQMPVITTLHTILDKPSESQKAVLLEIAAISRKLISISQKGIEILQDTYGISASKCEHIQHGVHKVETQDTAKIKQKLGVDAKKVLLTFGLLSRNKSIEVVIKALPSVVEKHPDVIYVVLGETHPHVIKHEGEDYRHSLMRLVNKLKLEKNVIFINRFASNKELFEFLRICDIYVIPYLGENQISSGTLIYTMGAGTPIISTPFWYAQEMLADSRGLLFDFGDSGQLAEKIIYLLDNETERKRISGNALALAEQCYWPNIGRQHVDLLKNLSREDSEAERYQMANDIEFAFPLPPLNLHHLRVLTDDTGIFQHSRYNIPDRAHGYCVDDNARALMLSVMLQNDVQDTDDLNRLTSIYLSFIDYSLNPANGKFRNFMSYERKWLEEEGSEDSAGRTLWALGYTAAYTRVSNFYYHSNSLFRRALESIDYISHPRALAYLILGLVHHAEMHGEAAVIRMLEKKAEQLSSFFDPVIHDAWPWFEPVVTYANSRIPQALMAAGTFLRNPDMVSRGSKILNWLISRQFSDDQFSPIGNKGWLTPDHKALFDQQPLEAHGMLDACLQAEEYTKDGKYADHALKAFAWFMGENNASSVLYDFATGGCRDGLHPGGVNLNQGAESTLSWLMSLISISYYLRSKSK